MAYHEHRGLKGEIVTCWKCGVQLGLNARGEHDGHSCRTCGYYNVHPEALISALKRQAGLCTNEGCFKPRAHRGKCAEHKQYQGTPVQKERAKEFYSRYSNSYRLASAANGRARRKGLIADLTEVQVKNLLDSTLICRYCGDTLTGDNRTFDHIVPIAKKGGSTIDNMQFICNKCNRAKFNDTEARFVEWLERAVKFRSEGE